MQGKEKGVAGVIEKECRGRGGKTRGNLDQRKRSGRERLRPGS